MKDINDLLATLRTPSKQEESAYNTFDRLYVFNNILSGSVCTAIDTNIKLHILKNFDGKNKLGALQLLTEEAAGSITQREAKAILDEYYDRTNYIY
jgi:hypothetical protein